MKFYLCIFLLILLGGCSTHPVKLSDSKSVPDERLYEPYAKYKPSSANSGKIVVVRDSGFAGSAGYASLYFNGEMIAKLKPYEAVIIHAEQGDNIIGVGPGGMSVDSVLATTELIEQTVHVDKDKEYYYRVSIDPYKGLIIHRSTQIK